MDPVTITLGGTTLTLLGVVGKIMFNYGRDRKELNGTVERVKKIEEKLDKHMMDETEDMTKMHQVMSEINTKVSLLIDGRIKEI